MKNIRVIARLDVKPPNLIKGIHLEGFRRLGDPMTYTQAYYQQGIDEIIYMDIVASLYERNGLYDLVEKTTHDVFVPITLGGGIRTIEDVQLALRSGADKVAINTAAIKNPKLISEVANRFGSQCVVLSIEAKRKRNNLWHAYYDNGREDSGLNVMEWAKQGQSLGAGEILITSVDQEGTEKGFDEELVHQLNNTVDIPTIASGGMGKMEDFINIVNYGRTDAVAIASVLHYNKLTINDIKTKAYSAGISTRR